MIEDKGTALLAVPCLMDYKFFKAAINLPDTPSESRLFFQKYQIGCGGVKPVPIIDS